MEESTDRTESSLETRVAALELAVERLSSFLEPGFAVANLSQPVATLILKEASFHDYTAKFFAVLDIGEALLKYAVVLPFAAVLEAGGAHAEKVVELFKSPPSLGKLVGAFRAV